MLVDDDLSRCQLLAEELEAHSYRGVMSPSAALPGSVNLTLFGERREHEVTHELGGFNQAGNLRPDWYVTTAHLARGATSPGFVLRLVRYPGDPHLGYERWKRSYQASTN